MISAEVTDGYDHVVDDSIGEVVGSDKEVRAMLCFAKNIRNAVCIYGFTLIVGVMVFVLGFVCCGHDGKTHERIRHGHRFLEMVSAIVPAALQSAFLRSELGNVLVVVREFTAAIFGVALVVEPGFGFPATLDAKEF